MPTSRFRVRALMIAVAVVAIGYWTIETSNRWIVYRQRAEFYARMESANTALQSHWDSAAKLTDELLLAARGERGPADVSRLSNQLDFIYDHFGYDSNYNDRNGYHVITLALESDPANWDMKTRARLSFIRTNATFLTAVVAYDAKLRRKYQYGAEHPWIQLDPDPPAIFSPGLIRH
jgi:hypothetical protein